MKYAYYNSHGPVPHSDCGRAGIGTARSSLDAPCLVLRQPLRPGALEVVDARSSIDEWAKLHIIYYKSLSGTNLAVRALNKAESSLTSRLKKQLGSAQNLRCRRHGRHHLFEV